MGELGVTEIELDRGPCLGTCPVFRFKATAAGRYEYEGGSFAEPVGTRSGRFPSCLFERLAEVCRDLNVLALDDRYPTHFDDASMTIVTIRHAGGTKTIVNEAGYGPVRLWAFAILIEHAMRQAFATEERDRRRK